jgi:hypothetical protein
MEAMKVIEDQVGMLHKTFPKESTRIDPAFEFAT